MIHKVWGGLIPILALLLASCAVDPSYPLLASRFPLPPAGTDVVGGLAVVRAHARDLLADVARHFDLGHDEILDANPTVNPSLPGEGARILLPTQHILPPGQRQGIVVNLASLRLYYYPADGRTVITHPVGIGRGSWATPEGSAWIVGKDIDPVWHVPVSIRIESARLGAALPASVSAGPDNPLGQYALRLNLPGYLIHGTNRPYGVGMRVSHGCVNLYPEDISALFPEVPIKTRVLILNRPVLVGRIAGRPYLEVHSSEEAATVAQVRQAAQEAGIDPVEVDWDIASHVAQAAIGVPLPIYRNAPTPESALAAVPVVEWSVR